MYYEEPCYLPWDHCEMGGGRNSWSDKKVFWPVIDHSAPMHPIVFNSHLGYFTLNWCSCAHSKELRPGLYPCGSVTALESVRTEREKHRETWRKVAIKVPTDQSINQQFGLDLPHPLSIPKLSTVSRGNKCHIYEFFMPGPCIKRQDSESPWRD